MLFSRPNAEVALQWSGKLGPTIDVDAASTTFVDLYITDEGRWEVDPDILNMFIHAADQDIKYRPVIVAEPYDAMKACDLRLADDVRSCLLCDAAVPLRIMLDHVAEHIAKRRRGRCTPPWKSGAMWLLRSFQQDLRNHVEWDEGVHQLPLPV